MAINYDTSRVPTGELGWVGLAEAVESADPNDENEWIEFKAHLDPTTPHGRFVVAKAIVAFANRDPQIAAKWFGGHAVILIGVAPGDVVGAPDIDPADLHNSVAALVADPAPHWDAIYFRYKGKPVIGITVGPPCYGDPIACIGKSSGEAVDGHVYVRRLGKSDRARSADLHRLATRLTTTRNTIRELVIAPPPDAHIPVIAYPENWIDEWISAERTHLLAPLEPAATDTFSATTRFRGLAHSLRDDGFLSVGDMVMGALRREENRTPEEFNEEVEQYLDRASVALDETFDRVRASAATKFAFRVRNESERNLENVLVILHIEGATYGYGHETALQSLRKHLPEPPRPWGPWIEQHNPFPHGLGHISQRPNFDALRPASPTPTITNGGSVDMKCVPLHLRPKTTEELLTVWLVADTGTVEPVRVTWTATATNADARLEGEFILPVADTITDLSEVVRCSHE